MNIFDIKYDIYFKDLINKIIKTFFSVFVLTLCGIKQKKIRNAIFLLWVQIILQNLNISLIFYILCSICQAFSGQTL